MEQRRRMADAADFGDFRFGAAARHLCGGRGGYDIGFGAADEQRGAAHRVVDVPELEILLRHGGAVTLPYARIVMRSPGAVIVAPYPRLGEEAPLGVAVRTERRGDLAN